MDPTPISPTVAQAALDRLAGFPVAQFGHYPTPVDELARFRAGAALRQQILVKRDDAISFGFGGNKVRKLRYVIPPLLADGVDTVITCGGLQSNHARATAAAATVSGLQCHIIVNGTAPRDLTGNARLNRLLGASVDYVTGREMRRPGMEAALARFAAAGRRPAIIPLGASTAHGALGFVAAVGEMVAQGITPDVIVHAGSSGGTSAGLLAGVALHRLPTRVVSISADDPPAAIEAEIREITTGLDTILDTGGAISAAIRPEIDDGYVGPGYGEPTPGSTEAQQRLARDEALFVDHTYTAKAAAGMIDYCRRGLIAPDASVLFWHTGGQVALFA
ncbi:MAG: 1-aminocyclopropane-1-carboxylate deaminase/D-cysteine desulfhydrase [Gemmatimonadales bacterium]